MSIEGPDIGTALNPGESQPQVVSLGTLVCPHRIASSSSNCQIESYVISAELGVAPCSQGAQGSSLEEADVSQRDDAQHAKEDDVGQHDEQTPASEAVLVAENARDELRHARQLRRRGLQQQQQEVVRGIYKFRKKPWVWCWLQRKVPIGAVTLSFPHASMHGVSHEWMHHQELRGGRGENPADMPPCPLLAPEEGINRRCLSPMQACMG